MYCKYCGEKLKDGSKFCGKCGKAQDVKTANIVKDKSKKETGIVKDHKKNRYKIIKIGLPIIAIVLIGLLGVMFKQRTYRYLAIVQDGNGKYGYINEKGKEVIECKYDIARIFNQSGVTAVGKSAGEDEEGQEQYKYAIIDRKGKEITPFQYDEARVCSDKLIAVARSDGKDEEGNTTYKWGFVNEKGDQIVDFKYQYESMPWKRLGLKDKAVVSIKKEDEFGNYEYNYGVIDSTGKEVIPISDQRISDFDLAVGKKELVAVEREGKYGFLNFENEIVIPFEYEDAMSFADNGLAAVKKNGLWGYIDEKGKVKIPFQYDDARIFGQNGWAFVKEQGQSAFIDSDGNERLAGEWEECRSGFDEWGLASVSYLRDDERVEFTVIDENGHEIFPEKYNSIDCYEGIVEYRDKDGEINYLGLGKNGEVIWENYRHTSWRGDNDWVAVWKNGEQSQDGERTVYQVKFFDSEGNEKLRLDKKYSYVGNYICVK